MRGRDRLRMIRRDVVARWSSRRRHYAPTARGTMKRLDALEDELDLLRGEHREHRREVREILLALAAAEGPNRKRLEDVRAAPGWAQGWDEADPLVSITVTTTGRDELFTRTLPSLLAQDHSNIEVIVACDGCHAEVADRLDALRDERLSHFSAGLRQPLFDDPREHWLSAATRARNQATARATGSWIVEFDDDDALRAEAIETLLETAREHRAEAAYGRAERHGIQTGPKRIGSFPPREGRFTWAAGIYRSELRFFGREHVASDLGIPGDWWLTERMLRAGVRFAMTEAVVCDIHPAGPSGGAGL